MAKLKVGMFEGQENEQWMSGSGIKFDYRYRYLTEGWANNWGYGANDGAFAMAFFKDCEAKGFVPAVAYYCAFDLAPGGLGSYDKLKNISSQKKFFSDLKLFFQQARTYGKEVLLCVEPDLTGFLQGELKGLNLTPSSAYAAVAATGLPELQGLQDTVAGWGKAFVVLRNVVGATNVKLGLHVSGWSSGRDVLYGNTSDSFQSDVDQTIAFLTPMGLSQYDVLVTDPIDRDAEFYNTGLEYAKQNRWMTTGENDSINSQSFNRYFAWLKAFNTATNKEFICWQIPLGNANSPNIPHDPTKVSGYQSNHVEYFFGPNGASNRARALASGVTTLLFGEGEYRQTSRLTDGGYFKSVATAYINGAGDVAPAPTLPTVPVPAPVAPPVVITPPVLTDASIAAGWKLSKVLDIQYNCVLEQVSVPVVIPPVVVQPPVVPPVVVEPPPVVVPPVVAPDATYQFDFEGSLQGWTKVGSAGVISTLSSDNSFAASGAKSLKIVLSGVGTQQVSVANPSIPPGSKISFSIYIPKIAIGSLKSLQVFAQESTPTKWRWNAQWIDAATLKGDAWNGFTITIPPDASAIQSMGIEVTTTAANAGTIYLDAVGWGSNVTAPVATTPPVVQPAPVTPPVTQPPVVTPEPVPPAVVVAPVGGKKFKIMCIGDSITAEEHSWRKELARLLQADGYDPTFVGSVRDQYQVPAQNHEGHSGFSIQGISDIIVPLLQQYTPDVITLMIGTNDLAWWVAQTGTQVGQQLLALRTKIQNAAPNAKIITCTIAPQGSLIVQPNNVDRQTLVSQYNSVIRANSINLADINSVLTVADTRDQIHPTADAGIKKMAPAFLAAVKKVLV